MRRECLSDGLFYKVINSNDKKTIVGVAKSSCCPQFISSDLLWHVAKE